MLRIITAVALATSIATAESFIALDQKLTEHRLQDVANASIECFSEHPELVKEADGIVSVAGEIGKSNVSVDAFEKAVERISKFRQSIKSTCGAYNNSAIEYGFSKTEQDLEMTYSLLGYIASCKNIPALIKEIKAD